MSQITLELKNLSDSEVLDLLKKYKIDLTVAEARKIEQEILGRPMTLTEAVVWGIQGSEHCSYKSSKKHLKQLPTSAPNVIQGPQEDAGIVEIAKHGNEKFGIIFGHESHNHPSQIVPYEGAATGVGGMVRDICCMGGKVIAIADPLRFGEISSNRSKWIAGGVVSGIAGYGNPIGVPNIAGDIYFNSSFNENCLVNVVALGVVKESGIIHSYAPQMAGEQGFNMILVGKPTDNSGFGGASFASFELESDAKEKNKGAVQEPNAFLKRHLLESTFQLFAILREKNLINQVGFKDIGGGGLLCASVEMAAAAGFGAEIDLSKIHVSMDNLAPHVVLTSETQERFMWIASDEVTNLILNHYNQVWALPKVSKGARAQVMGKVTVGGQYIVKAEDGEVVVNAKAKDITEGLQYDRPYSEGRVTFAEPNIKEPEDYSEILLKILAHENVASRSCIYERYDKTVQGATVLEPGQADAGVIRPLIDEDVPDEIKNIGVALSVDCNPFYGRISPYWGAVNAVVESMRNVAAVGAVPWAITDCLNYGNPEKPNQMWQLVEGIRGVGDACRQVNLKGHKDSAVPVVSGNVSLYNESKSGSVDPSAIIACLGRLEDYRKAITSEFKQTESEVFLLGERKDELGGSVYYQLFGELGANVPKVDFKQARDQIYAVTDMIDSGLLLSCHDISEGGLAVTLAEMCFGGDGKNQIGTKVDLGYEGDLRMSQKLFSETGGFVLEAKDSAKVKQIAQKYGLNLISLGTTTLAKDLIIKDDDKEVIRLSLAQMSMAWLNGLRDKLAA